MDAVQQSLDRIAELDATINAFTVVTGEAALARARAVDRGEVTGPLAGVPISIKDHIWVRGLPATNGSRALADFVPGYDCVCVSRLLDAGAVIVGKTNNPEFCYRGTTENELWGVTRNPHNPERTAGGSSGGAAASVAAGMVPLAVGTDGGGSIRIPSAFCGTFGLKPTFGLIPKMPGFRGWPTLSVTGPIASSARDLALAAAVMAGPSAADPLTYPAPPTDYMRALDEVDVPALRIAVSSDLGISDVDPDVRAAFAAAVEKLGAIAARAHPYTVDPAELWDRIALPEGYASEGELVENRGQLVGADAAAIALSGRTTSARQYLDAQHDRAAFTGIWTEFFTEFDVLLTPAMPTTAFALGRFAPETINGHAVPESFDAWCALALPANLAGLPAVAAPIGVGRDGLPVGMQVLGPRWSDATVLAVAAAVSAAVAER